VNIACACKRVGGQPFHCYYASEMLKHIATCSVKGITAQKKYLTQSVPERRCVLAPLKIPF